MKRCNSCEQILSQRIRVCPACGSQLMAGLSHIDEYKILSMIHEGRSSMVFKAAKPGGNPVSIRLFTTNSGVDETIAQRLKKELEELKTLPPEYFVQHFALKKSQDGLWYRVSEWLYADDWASIFVSGILQDRRNIIRLFLDITLILDSLQKKKHFMPFLILDDVLVSRKNGGLKVKINYKLSRFLTAEATHHGPMLQKLLDTHPDILNHRAIDPKSAIWSLGKLFVEILTANPDIKNYSEKIDHLPDSDPKLVTLLKLMLSSDPDVRPKSMEKIAAVLTKILERIEQRSSLKQARHHRRGRLPRELGRLKKMVALLLIFLMALLGGASLFVYNSREKPRPDVVLSEKLNTYAGSVGFLLVEYWIKQKTKILYKNKVEGTGFLVDKDGYILTNKHVACPWLEDTSLFQMYAGYSSSPDPPVFGYRMYLWFEGEKAFNRLPALEDSPDLSDAFHLATAYSSGGKGNLRIVGVPKSSNNTRETINAPFKYDYAILKIDNPPPGLTPLPCETAFNPEQLQRLALVTILGFPLGHRTQDERISTSITRGHVRRTDKEMIQVDSSIYKGNSGGPVINDQGQVIGIASGVVTDQLSGYFKITTPLSDFGLILPITGPARLLEAIRSGRPHWDGVLDFSLGPKLERITELSESNRFQEARDIVDELLQTSKDPSLMLTAGILNLCTQDFEKAEPLLKTIIQIEPDNTTARFFLFLLEWMTGLENPSPMTRPLFGMRWYDKNEFFGYLTQTLKNETPMSDSFIDYENRAEKSWRSFIDGLICEKRNDVNGARERFRQSILDAGLNDWIYFIAFSRLNSIQQPLPGQTEKDSAPTQTNETFQQKAMKSRKTLEKTWETLTELFQQFESVDTPLNKKKTLVQKIYDIAPDNRTFHGRIIFSYAAQGFWDQALALINERPAENRRETLLSLGLGLLKCRILKINGQPDQAATCLTQFSQNTQNLWYSDISRRITSETGRRELFGMAGNSPEKRLVLYTALGLWAEGEKDLKTAADHYREALGTYLESWNEYDLALGRILSIRRQSETPSKTASGTDQE